MTASAPNQPDLDDPRIFAALEVYQAECAAGRRPDRADFLAKYADFAPALAGCLEALDFVGAAGKSGSSTPSPARSEVVPGAVLGEYRLVREVGRGGMGIVFEAEHLTLGRRVALKVLPHVGSLEERQVRRFRNEVQAVASLDHPNIVAVYEANCAQGVHFYAMQFIEGFTLARLIDESRRARTRGSTHAEQASTLDPNRDGPATEEFSPASPGVRAHLPGGETQGTPPYFRAVARILEQAARALHHAHLLGVIHRDIKPGNLMLDHRGALWVTDFGLAKLPGSELTATGELVGTLRYMSPEQAQGQSLRIDPRTDVYSLGATLHELLTLQPAFSGDDRNEVLHRILHVDPPLARQIKPGVPPELEVITARSLAKEPGERYASAEELADDLRRFQEDRPILARPPGLALRVRKWGRRNRALVWSAGVAMALFLVASVAVLAVSNARILDAKGKADEALLDRNAALGSEKRAKEDALAAGERSEYTRYVHTVALAHREWLAGNPLRVRHLLDSCPERFRGWEWRYLDRLPGKPLLRLSGAGRSFLDMKYSPDGSQIATVSEQGEVQFWDARTGQPQGGARPDPPATRISYHPDGKSLVIAHRTTGPTTLVPARQGSLFPLFPSLPVGLISRVEIATGKRLAEFRGRGAYESPMFHPGGKRLVAASTNQVRVWEVDSGKLSWTGPGRLPAYNGQGTRLAVARSGKVVVLDAGTHREVRALDAPWGAESLAFHPDGVQLSVGTAFGAVMTWNTATGASVSVVPTGSPTVHSLAYSPDGHLLATASAEGHAVGLVRSFPANRGQPLRGLGAGVAAVAFHPEGTQVLAVGRDGTARQWHLLEGQGSRLVAWKPFDEKRAAFQGRGLAFDPTGTRLVCGGGQVASEIDLRTGGLHPLPTIPELLEIDRPLLAYCSADGLLRVGMPQGSHAQIQLRGGRRWSLHRFPVERKPRARAQGSSPQVEEVAFDDSGEYLAFLGQDGQFRVRSTVTGNVRACLQQWHDPAKRHALALDRRGVRLAVAGYEDRTLTVFDVEQARILHQGPCPVGHVLSARFSPAGDALLLAGEDGGVALIDPKSGEVLRAWQVPRQPQAAFAFTPDGTRLAMGLLRDDSGSGGVVVWELRTGEELLTLPCDSSVLALAFSPDGDTLAASRADGQILLWESASLAEPDRLALLGERVRLWHLGEARLGPTHEMHRGEWHLTHLLRDQPTNAEWLIPRAVFRLRQGKKEPATLDARSALGDPRSVDSLSLATSLAEVLLETQDLPGLRHFAAWMAVRLDRPDSTGKRLTEGLELLTIVPGVVSEETMLRVAHRLLARKPRTFEQFSALGLAYLRAGRWQEARQSFQRSITFARGKNRVNRFGLAMAEYRLGNAEEARKQLTQGSGGMILSLGQLDDSRARTQNLRVSMLEKEARTLLAGKK